MIWWLFMKEAGVPQTDPTETAGATVTVDNFSLNSHNEPVHAIATH